MSDSVRGSGRGHGLKAGRVPGAGGDHSPLYVTYQLSILELIDQPHPAGKEDNDKLCWVLAE